jgi:hypothetical protein
VTGSDNGTDIAVGEPAVAQAFALGSTTFCEGGAVLLEAQLVDGQTYQWLHDGVAIDGATAPSLEASLPGEYAVVAANQCGEVTSDVVAVVVDLLPVHSPQQQSVALCAGSTAILVGVDQSGQQGLAYQWSFQGSPIAGAVSATLETGVPGSYTLEVVNPETGCTYEMAPVQVEVETVPTPSLSALGATTFCEGGSVVLEAEGDAPEAFLWTLNGVVLSEGDEATWTATESGLYAVAAMSSSGCVSTASDGVAVTVDPLPTTPEVSTVGNPGFCVGGGVQLIAESAGAFGYQWFADGLPLAGADQQQLFVEEEGSYTVLAISAEGCVSATSEATVVEVYPIPEAPAVVALGATSFCAGGSVLLQAADLGEGGYQWTLDDQDIPGATDLEYTATAAGPYALVYTSPLNCSSDPSEAIVLEVLPGPAGPVIFPEGPQSVCAGDVVELAVDAVAGLSYQWLQDGTPMPGAESYAVQVGAAGSYTVAVVDADGCQAVSTLPVDVEVLELPDAPVIEQVVDTLFASGDGPFQWLFNGESIPGATGPFHVVTENGTYAVVVTGGNGCTNGSEPFQFDQVCIAALAGPMFALYPNPNDGAFVLRLDFIPHGDVFYTVHDATGRLVQRSGLRDRLTDIHLGGVPAGVYVLQVVQGTAVTTARVLVGR